MSVYKKVIFTTVILAVALACSVLVLNQSQSTEIFSAVITFTGLLDILATIYIGKLIKDDPRRPRGWLLPMLFASSLLVTAGTFPIVLLVALRFLGLPPLPNNIGLLITGTGLSLVTAAPLMKAVVFFLVGRDRKSRQKDSPPISRETDISWRDDDTKIRN